jgi:hypothetical protein
MTWLYLRSIELSFGTIQQNPAVENTAIVRDIDGTK